MASTFEFVLNGRVVHVDGTSATTSLLSWLRSSGHTGSKEGCAEGDCGACAVALVDTNAAGERTYRAVNSCITLLPMVAGREVVTVEGLSPEGGPLHPVQQAMVASYGSQCGYCTSGFVVSMFEGYYRGDMDTREKIVDQLNGNLCRCTGYRPIREAMEDSLAKRLPTSDLFQLRLTKNSGGVPALEYEGNEGHVFLRPTTLDELLVLKDVHRDNAELVGGATEIGVYINKYQKRYARLVSTEGVRELSRIDKSDTSFTIGSGATLTAIEEALAGEYPMIDKMLRVFASRPIRNRATLAGNLVTASPIGDMAPLMLALDASVVLARRGGSRTVPVADFFLVSNGAGAGEVVVTSSTRRHADIDQAAWTRQSLKAPRAGYQHRVGRVRRRTRRDERGAPRAARLRRSRGSTRSRKEDGGLPSRQGVERIDRAGS